MGKKIILVTKLSDNVSVTSGGGKRMEIAEWNLGPQNLIAAVKSLCGELAENRRAFGDIGIGTSWLEINGHRFNPDDFNFGDFGIGDARQVIAHAA